MFVYLLIIAINLFITYTNHLAFFVLDCDRSVFACLRTWFALVFLLINTNSSLQKILRKPNYFKASFYQAILNNIIIYLVGYQSDNPQICYITYNLQTHFQELHKGKELDKTKLLSIIFVFSAAIMLMSQDVQNSVLTLALLAPFHFIVSYSKLYSSMCSLDLSASEAQCSDMFLSAVIGTFMVWFRDESWIPLERIPMLVYIMPLVGLLNGFYVFFINKSDILQKSVATRFTSVYNFNTFFEINLALANFFTREIISGRIAVVVSNLAFDFAFLIFIAGSILCL